MTTKTDDELFDAMVAGDKRAPTALYDRHFAAVRGYFINKAANPAVVDDLAQETFVVLIKNPENFRRQGSVRAFLFGVAHNVLRSHYRKTMRDRLVLIDDISVADMGPGVSTLVAQRAETQRLIEALRHIDTKYQNVFEMFYWQDLSAREIGLALDIPEGTARSRLRLAKKALLAALNLRPQGFTELLGNVRDVVARAHEVKAQLEGRAR